MHYWKEGFVVNYTLRNLHVLRTQHSHNLTPAYILYEYTR